MKGRKIQKERKQLYNSIKNRNTACINQKFEGYTRSKKFVNYI